MFPEQERVICTWCNTVYSSREGTNCKNCGGQLPSPQGPDPGPSPGPSPRHVPNSYWWRIMVWKNVFVILGVIFTVPLSCTLIFPAIGIPLWIIGYRRANAKLMALEKGTTGEAVVMNVRYDQSIKINNQSPWMISYVIETSHGPVEGWAHAWEQSTMPREGDHMWAVYLPEDPKQNALWPPIQ